MAKADLIADRYKVLDTLGQGGMATVYLAKDEQLGRLVAIKMLLMTDLTDGQAIRFQNEAKAIGKLKHSAIMTALDFGVTKDGQPYLVLEHQEGTTLDTILEEKGRLEIGEALLIASRICDGLAYAHKAGILHRDIKPPNIYIANSEATRESVKILDFGIAKFQSSQADECGGSQAEGEQSEGKRPEGKRAVAKSAGPSDSEQRLTRTGTIIGSPAYMSPEQARGEPVDERADIYSLGCILFEMLTGKPPIMGKTAVETIAKKSSQSAPTLASQAPDVDFSNALESIVAKSLAADRSNRYRKASDLLVDLESLLSELSEEDELEEERTDAEPVEPRDRKPSHTFDSPVKVSAVAVVMVLLVVLIGSTMAFFMFARPASDKGEHPKIKPFSSLEHEKLLPEEEMKYNVSLGGNGVEIRRAANDEDLQKAAALMKKTGATSLIVESLENFDGDKLKYFENLPIKQYIFQRMTLDKKALERVNNTRTLERLAVDGCKPLSTIITKPEKLTNLHHLSVKAVALTDEDCKTIPRLKSLASISLEATTGFSPDFLKSLAKIPTFNHIFIGGDHWTDEHIKVLSSMKLVDVELFHSRNISVATLMKSIGEMKNLTFLHATDMKLGGSLGYLQNQPTLQYIKLNRITGLTKADFVSLSKMKRLNYIELSSVNNVEDTDILPLLNCKTLRKFDLDEVPGVTRDAILEFKKLGVAARSDHSSMDVAKLVGPMSEEGSTVDKLVKSEEPPKPGNSSPSSESSESTGAGPATKSSQSTHSSSERDAGCKTIFNDEYTCELKGTYYDKDMLDLVEKIKTKYPNHRGFSMGHVDNFNSSMLKYLIPLKPVSFKATAAELDQASFRYIGQMTSLNFLGLDNNLFAPGSLQMLKRLQNVRHLRLTGITLNDADLETVASLNAIEKLNIKSSSGFSLKALEKLRNLPHLTNLQIGGHTCTPEQARCFHGFKKIRTAELAGPLEHRASDILKEMSFWPNVERFTFSAIDLLPEDVEAIAKFPSLEDLKFSHLKIKDKEKVFDLLSRFKLENLELELIENLTDTDVVKLRQLKSVQEIILSRNTRVTDSAISQLKAAMPHAEVRKGQ